MMVIPNAAVFYGTIPSHTLTIEYGPGDPWVELAVETQACPASQILVGDPRQLRQIAQHLNNLAGVLETVQREEEEDGSTE